MSDIPVTMDSLSERERAVITYLSSLMEANARMVGEHLAKLFEDDGKNPSSVGAAICGAMKEKGLVYRLPELNAWRLTALGRQLAHDERERLREAARTSSGIKP